MSDGDLVPFISLYKTQLSEFRTSAVSRRNSLSKDKLEKMLDTLQKRIDYSFEGFGFNSQMKREYHNLVNEFEEEIRNWSK